MGIISASSLTPGPSPELGKKGWPYIKLSGKVTEWNPHEWKQLECCVCSRCYTEAIKTLELASLSFCYAHVTLKITENLSLETELLS